jgi:predicted ester cyclase
MSVEENKAKYRELVEEGWNKGNLSVIDTHVHPDFVYSSPFGEYKGQEGFKQMVTMLRTVFPDLHYTIDDMIGEGDKMAVQVTLTGTMKGAWLGSAPTGKKINVTSAYFYLFKDGKEAEAVPFSDSLVMFQQLGISPPRG